MIQKLPMDLDGDGIVTVSDILEVLAGFGQFNTNFQSSAEQVDALINSIVDQFNNQ